MTNVARDYIARGLAVVPVPFGEKWPSINDWQKLVTTPDFNTR